MALYRSICQGTGKESVAMAVKGGGRRNKAWLVNRTLHESNDHDMLIVVTSLVTWPEHTE